MPQEGFQDTKVGGDGKVAPDLSKSLGCFFVVFGIRINKRGIKIHHSNIFSFFSVW